MTGYGFIGPMTAAGTTFLDKDAGSGGALSVGSRYRHVHRYGGAAGLALSLWRFLWPFWIVFILK